MSNNTFNDTTPLGSYVSYGREKWRALSIGFEGSDSEKGTVSVTLIRQADHGQHVTTRVPIFWWDQIYVL